MTKHDHWIYAYLINFTGDRKPSCGYRGSKKGLKRTYVTFSKLHDPLVCIKSKTKILNPLVIRVTHFDANCFCSIDCKRIRVKCGFMVFFCWKNNFCAQRQKYFTLQLTRIKSIFIYIEKGAPYLQPLLQFWTCHFCITLLTYRLGPSSPNAKS